MGVLTKREKEVLDFIKGYMETNGVIPTMAEIGMGTYMSAKVANDHFRRLIEKGYISQISNKRYVVKGMRYVNDL